MQGKIITGKTTEKKTPWTFNACKKRIDEANTPEKQVAMWTELNMWVYADGKDPFRWDCYWAFMDAWEKLYKEPEWIGQLYKEPEWIGQMEKQDDLVEF